MSAALERAIAADAEAGRVLAHARKDEVHTRAGSAASRRRRRRTALLGGGAGAGLVAVAVALGAVGAGGPAGAGPDDRDAAAAPSTSASASSAPVSEGVGTIYAEELIASAKPRVRGLPVRGQAAVLCPSGLEAGSIARCTAVTVGESALLVADSSISRMDRFVADGHARVNVAVMFTVTGSRALAVSDVLSPGVIVSDPDAESDGWLGGDRATSLWNGYTTRSVVMPERPWGGTLEPTSYLSSNLSADAAAPDPGEQRDPVWAVANAGANAEGTVVTSWVEVEARTVDPESTLLLEVSTPVRPELEGLTANEIAVGFTERSRDDADREGATRALLCDVDDAWRREVDELGWTVRDGCAAGWVDGTYLSADANTDWVTDGGAVWEVRNASGGELLMNSLTVIVEHDAASLEPSRSDTLGEGYGIAFDTNAWTGATTRSAAIATYGYPQGFAWERMGAWWTELTNGQLAELGERGAATAQVAMPFLGDDSRILVLEVPLPLDEPVDG
ncbi:hypothetical protein [Demequina gelatinilytica]|uniref:hypothetical protein n=1 Tax=Demequina gelatinilytica TaxID=1638980 RepID=UPI000ADBC1A9|nr:hypothetical protein [Demequina gelatinilytica]